MVNGESCMLRERCVCMYRAARNQRNKLESACQCKSETYATTASTVAETMQPPRVRMAQGTNSRTRASVAGMKVSEQMHTLNIQEELTMIVSL